MKEAQRLKALREFKILNTPSEKKLTDILEIAAALCDAPISLISLVDDHRLFFKVKNGLDFNEVPREHSFCSYAIDSPNTVLIVNNPLDDSRFDKNPLVLDKPDVRFYAGVPLKTSKGAVLGTLCIMDTKPRILSENKIKALKLLSEEVMDYLETRKNLVSKTTQIEQNESDLRNFSGQSSSIFLQFEVKENGQIDFGFLSKGLQKVHSTLTPETLKKHPKKILDIIHPDDCDMVLKSIVQSFLNTKPWEVEFRIQREDTSTAWYLGVAKPEKRDDGRVVWYGTFQDISNKKEYVSALEQMSFDISHVLRKPVTTLMSIVSVIEIEKELDEDSLRMYAGYLKSIGEELDVFTKMLNDTYHSKWMRLNQ